MDHAGFGVLPRGALETVTNFEFSLSDEQVSTFQALLRLSPVGPETWYNRQEGLRFGISRRWMIEAKLNWEKHDFHGFEDKINSIPNFKASITDPDHGLVSIHFAAMFSQKANPIPIIFLHGWPGSFLEFWPMLRLLVHRYTPETLPYHIVVPSLPGYGFSSNGNLNSELTLDQAPRLLHQLMLDLGFGAGYVAQGGDVGSNLASQMSAKFEECKAFHLNFLIPESSCDAPANDGPTASEKEQLERGKLFAFAGSAYALEHGFRPATIGICLSSSPLALLA